MRLPACVPACLRSYLPTCLPAYLPIFLSAYLPSLLQVAALAAALEGDGAGFLHALLAAHEEDRLLVLHPAAGVGFEMTARGVVDNFQLHTLLAAALVPEGVPGERPSEAVVAVMRGEGPQAIEEPSTASWSLVGWRALGADGRVLSVRRKANSELVSGGPTHVQ